VGGQVKRARAIAAQILADLRADGPAVAAQPLAG
jgi:hypothetical protein